MFAVCEVVRNCDMYRGKDDAGDTLQVVKGLWNLVKGGLGLPE